MKFLIEQGVNINLSTPSGETPLHIVLGNGALDLLKILVDNGVDTDFYQTDSMMTPLMFAIRNNQSEVVKILLSSDRENVNKKGRIYARLSMSCSLLSHEMSDEVH